MSKVTVELIHEVLSANNLDQEAIQKILAEIETQAQAEADAAAAERDPARKTQPVIVISDPRGQIPDADYVGWVFTIPEDDSPTTALEKLIRATYEYNISKKGRRHPAKSVGEACEAVGTRFLKEQDLAIRTKIPVTVIRTDNKIPEIEDDFAGA